jgi:hypothetical protein
MAMPTVEELAGSAAYQINLIAPVGLLRILPFWCIEFDFERAVRKDRHRQIAFRRRALRERLREAHVKGSD